MKGIASLAALLLVLTACGSSEEQPEQQPNQPPSPEGQAPQKSEGTEDEKKTDPGSEGVTLIRQYKDLEEFAGQSITVEGIFKVFPKFKGKHGMIVLDSGLVIYLIHVDAYWRGENWWLHEGKRCRVTGRLHTFVGHPIDGMTGPYMDEVTPLTVVGRDAPAAKEGVPKKAAND
jgi:hypothetical protein